MLHRFVLTTLIVMSVLVWAGAQEDSGEALPKQVKEIFNKPLYQEAKWGLRVVDTADNRVLLDHHPDECFYIGSVRKVFSVGLLLDQVGPNHTYDTPVFRRGKLDSSGVLDGDLILLASGDLTMGGRTNPDGSIAITPYDHNEANSLGNAVLSEPDPLAGYKSLAKQVSAAGITRVKGDVLIDDRLFQPFNFRDEFALSPIFVNDDMVDVSLWTTSEGDAARVEYRPHSEALKIRGTVQTAPAGSELELELTPEIPTNIGAPGLIAEISGLLPSDFVPPLTEAFPLVRTFRIAKPANYARSVFVEALEAEGVQVDAPTVKENQADKLPTTSDYEETMQVAELKGTPYRDLARFILKVSYNIGADTSLLLYGLTQGVDNMEDALEVERQTLVHRFQLDTDDFKFVDGSGGGLTQATNATVTSALSMLLKSPTGEIFQQSLPVLAVDGSLGFVTDFKADPSLAQAAGRVYAKTGTYVAPGEQSLIVKGQAFGGYIDTKSGKRIAYQLVVNEVPVEGLGDLMQIFQDQGTISAILWRDF
jgi:D-alanyl-D-alanine carboxypeptidase